MLAILLIRAIEFFKLVNLLNQQGLFFINSKLEHNNSKLLFFFPKPLHVTIVILVLYRMVTGYIQDGYILIIILNNNIGV